MANEMKARMLWKDLPQELVSQVEGVLGGAVVKAHSQSEGFSPGSADRIEAANGRRLFGRVGWGRHFCCLGRFRHISTARWHGSGLVADRDDGVRRRAG